MGGNAPAAFLPLAALALCTLLLDITATADVPVSLAGNVLPANPRRLVGPVFNKILIVCIGNICRSPTAEYLMRDRLRGRAVSVESAGLAALVDYPIDPTAGELLAEHGLDASLHRARQLDDAAIASADLILVMQRSHIVTLSKRSPHAVGRTFLLGKWQGDQEIPDPYRRGRSAFEHAYQLIEEGVGSWLRHF